MAVIAEEIGDLDGVDIDRDRALVLRYQRGDSSAFDELYKRYYPRLHLYCRRRVGDSHIAEELAQEAFVRALRAIPRLRGERRFYPWMTVIAQRLCIDHHRSTGRVEPAADIDTGTVDADPGDVFAAVDRGHLVAALDRVAPRHREVLHLREHEGWSYQQIADELEVPVTTVEALLHRARKSLRREFLAVGGGRLAAFPGLAGLGALIARYRARWGATDGSAARSGVQVAAASLAAATMVVAPLVITGTSSGPAGGVQPSRAGALHATSAGAISAPTSVVVVPAQALSAAANPSTQAPTAGEASSAGTVVGPAAVIYTTPGGAERAGNQAQAMPVSLTPAPDVRVGLDPAKAVVDLVRSLGGMN